jgi:ketosteroid isomerase-like protein
MKRILSFCFLTVAIAFLAVSFGMSSKSVASGQMYGNAQDEIKKLEQERNQAIVRNDAAALDRMSSADYTVINLRGELLNKTQIVNGFKSGAIKYDSRELSDLNVRVYGSTAVVTGRVNQKAMENGKDTSGEHRFTRVLVKEKGSWVSVAVQTTTIAK